MEGGNQNDFENLPAQGDFYDGINAESGVENIPKKETAGNNKQRLNIIVIVIVGIFAFGLGFYEIVNGIRNPFSFLDKNPIEQSQTMAIDTVTDTDGDGLSDYHETTVYGTSPFLEDTDGDGINDANEVTAGTDPNCPQGQQCTGGFNFGNSTGTANVPIFGQMPETGAPVVTPQMIREVLLTAGVSQSDLDELTDSDLIQLFQEMLAEDPELANISAQAGTTVVGGDSSQGYIVPGEIDISKLQINSMDDLNNLTGAQIKSLMIQNGAPAGVINEISDEEIKKMFLDKLGNN